MKKLRISASFLVFVLLLLTACQPKAEPRTPYGLEIHFIDVGQGDSVLITTGGKSMLVDAGTENYADTVCDYLRAQGIKQLDIALATHPHSDHIGGMAEVVNRFDPALFLMPAAAHTTPQFMNMLTALQNSGITAQYIYTGQVYNLGNAVITVLSPDKNGDLTDLNNSSAVILIEYDTAKILLTGDAERAVELQLLENDIIPVDILKLGHHGSSTSTIPEFFAHLSPDIAIVSCGIGNEYGHPHREVQALLDESGCAIYRTDLNGHIVLGIEKGEIYVATQR